MPEGERQRERAEAFAEGRPDADGVFGNVFEEVSRKRRFARFMD